MLFTLQFAAMLVRLVPKPRLRPRLAVCWRSNTEKSDDVE